MNQKMMEIHMENPNYLDALLDFFRRKIRLTLWPLRNSPWVRRDWAMAGPMGATGSLMAIIGGSVKTTGTLNVAVLWVRLGEFRV